MLEAPFWALKSVLERAHTVFHDTPAHRADCVTGSDQYPLFFCETRWVEDRNPAERLISVWPNMQKLFQFWLSLPKRQQPSGKSFEAEQLAIEDPVIAAKLSFLSYTASLLEPFLTRYQTSCPMVPYLYTDLTALFRSLMKIIVRDEMLEQCSIGYKLLQTNTCQNNLKSRKDFLLDLLPKAHSVTWQRNVFYQRRPKMSSMKGLSNVSKLWFAN